jgi:hypothetical protein
MRWVHSYGPRKPSSLKSKLRLRGKNRKIIKLFTSRSYRLNRKEDTEYEFMRDGLVQFEAKIHSHKNIRSRVIWPDSEGPWIEGAVEDLMVHFTYASWTAYNLGCALSMTISSEDENLGRSISDMMTRMISSMGAIQLAEICLTPSAMDELKRDRLEP